MRQAYWKDITFEAVSVGAIFAAFMLVASWFVRLNTAWTIALAGFAAGALGHLAFEAMGGNAWYCKHGAACKACSKCKACGAHKQTCKACGGCKACGACRCGAQKQGQGLGSGQGLGPGQGLGCNCRGH